MSDDLISRKAFMEYLGLEDTEENREENVGEIVTLEDFDRGDKPKIVRLPDEVNDKTHILIAWRPLLEPYQPERSDNHDGE